MNLEDRIYPAKLLLFGEHTVLVGSNALAVPFPKYFMRWIEKNGEHPIWLDEFIEYLEKECKAFLDLPKLQNWKDNYTIEANIPIGYGLGSSGALTAAIYDVAGFKSEEDNFALLQERFGKMESFFHGQSSGFDPLVSYFNKPILRSKAGLSILENDQVKLKFNCYLLDSGAPRKGKETIHQFLEKYNSGCDELNRLIANNNLIINGTINSKNADLQIVRKISDIQFNHLDFMILNDIKETWAEGLRSNRYFIKICGAGGGGFYLVFSKDELTAIGPYQLEKVEL